MAAFELRCELHGHQEDVRQLLVLDEDGALVTASRDKTAKLWLPEEASASSDGRGFIDAATFTGHTDYVVALARVPSSIVPAGLGSVGPRGALVTGSRDATLRLWRADDGAPLGGSSPDDPLRLVGHSYQVTGCGSLPNGDVVSCALDKAVKVWRLPQGKCAATLEGHEGPVLCLAVAPSGLVLTGGGDGTARLWSPGRGGACVAVFTGHTDTVRGVCVVPTATGDASSSSPLLRFATASHDCTLRVWTFDTSSSAGSSTPILVDASTASAVLRGHTAIIYACAASGDGALVASGAEDNTVRVWSTPAIGATGDDKGECLQVIPHPGCVWDVAFDPRPAVGGKGGDLFSACSDAVARAFTRDPSRAAPEADREALAASVAAHMRAAEAQAAKAEGAGGGDGGAGAEAAAPVPGLPPGLKVHDPTVLTAPGSKDGDVAVVRESDGAVNAYSWDAKAGNWEKVGEVVAAPAGGAAGAAAGNGGGAGAGSNTIAGGSRKWHAGREWDFVFDVEIGDGGPMRRLGCDRGENPYIVADRFMEQEELPASSDFREQIVRFITQNAGGGGGGGASLQDLPITGGGADPFTGGGGGGGGGGSGAPQRPVYVPPPRPMDITGGFVDPFTGGAGGGAGAGAGAAGGGVDGSAASSAASLPWRTFLLFNDPLAADKVGAKVRELSAALGGSDLALTEEEQGAPLEGLLRRAAAAAASGGASTPVPPLPSDQAAVLGKMLRWPPASVFPALDLARCLALEKAPVVPLGAVVGSGGDAATAGAALAGVAAASPPPAAALTTALRFSANAFFSDNARSWVLAQREALLGALAEALSGGGGAATATSTNKASRLALATLLLNYSAALASSGGADGEEEERLTAGMQLVSLADALAASLPADGSEDEAARRALVAVGSVVVGGGKGACGDGDVLRDAARAMESLVAVARRIGGGGGVDAAAVAQARGLLV